LSRKQRSALPLFRWSLGLRTFDRASASANRISRKPPAAQESLLQTLSASLRRVARSASFPCPPVSFGVTARSSAARGCFCPVDALAETKRVPGGRYNALICWRNGFGAYPASHSQARSRRDGLPAGSRAAGTRLPSYTRGRHHAQTLPSIASGRFAPLRRSAAAPLRLAPSRCFAFAVALSRPAVSGAFGIIAAPCPPALFGANVRIRSAGRSPLSRLRPAPEPR